MAAKRMRELSDEYHRKFTNISNDWIIGCMKEIESKCEKVAKELGHYSFEFERGVGTETGAHGYRVFNYIFDNTPMMMKIVDLLRKEGFNAEFAGKRVKHQDWEEELIPILKVEWRWNESV